LFRTDNKVPTHTRNKHPNVSTFFRTTHCGTVWRVFTKFAGHEENSRVTLLISIIFMSQHALGQAWDKLGQDFAACL
jgi:hypothetical protein